MSQTTGIIIALSFGVFMVLFEKWYSKYRTKKIQEAGLNIIPNFGFKVAIDKLSKYEKSIDGYSISMNHIRKNNFFAMHTLRIMVDFETSIPFSKLNQFVDGQRQNFPQFKWVANTIFKDLEFYRLNETVLKEVEREIIQMIDILKSENLNPISRSKGFRFGEDFDSWQMEN